LFLNKVPYFFYFRLKLFLVEMADEFEKLVNECTILSTEIIHNLERISSSQKQEEIENSNVEASRKLVKFKEVTELIENIIVPDNDHQVLTSKKLGESYNKLKADLKLKMRSAKARLENLSRDSLLGNSDGIKKQAVKSGPKISNGEAKTRLRQVNHLVGNILNQGQRAQEQLVDSSYVLRGTKGDLASGSDHLKNSKRLLEKLKRRKKTDQLIFFLCLAFFFATCLYILFKRFTPGFILRRVKSALFLS